MPKIASQFTNDELKVLLHLATSKDFNENYDVEVSTAVVAKLRALVKE